MNSTTSESNGQHRKLGLVWLAVALIAFYCGYIRQDLHFLVVGLFSLPISLGNFVKIKWPGYIGPTLAVISLVARLAMYAFSSQPQRWYYFVCAVIFAWEIWKWDVCKDDGDPKGSPDKEDKKPMISLVLLLREPRYLDDTILSNLASKAWKTKVASGEDGDNDAQEFVVGTSPIFMAKHGGEMFMIHNHGVRYFDSKAADHAKELRLKKALADHTAWLSVDYMRVGEEKPPEWAYAELGKLLAELAGEDCLAICCPAVQKIIPYDAEMAEMLRSDDPLKNAFKLFNPPVIAVGSDNTRMQEAVAEARRRWPEFVQAFEARRPDQRFAVKTPVSDGTHTEFMWVGVEAIENDVIYGRLDNKPVSVKVNLGDRLHVKLADLNDWIYSDNDGLKVDLRAPCCTILRRKRKRDECSS